MNAKLWRGWLFGIAMFVALLGGEAAELHEAVAAGNVAKVRELLRATPSLVNATDANGGTPLHEAARKGHTEIVQVLLSAKANPNLKDRSGLTPHRLASGYGHREVAALLQLQDSSPPSATSGGVRATQTAIHPIFDAIAWRKTDEVKAMLGQNPALVKVTNWTTSTPLHFAVDRVQIDIVKLLLARGADVSARDRQGATPLHHAADNRGAHAIIEALVSAGAEVNATNRYGFTPLFGAAQAGQLTNVQALLAAKADPRMASPGNITALHAACRKDATEVAVALLKAGANPNAREALSQTTALQLAVVSNNETLVRTLIAHGADVNLESRGTTPLAIATRRGFTNVMALLKQHGGIEKTGPPLKGVETDLVTTARLIDQAMRAGNRELLRTLFAKLEPTASDLEKIFGTNAARVAPVLAEERIAFQKEIARVRPAPPSLIVIVDFVPVEPLAASEYRKLVASDLPLTSLKENGPDGESVSDAAYCFVNNRWVRLPSIISLINLVSP